MRIYKISSAKSQLTYLCNCKNACRYWGIDATELSNITKSRPKAPGFIRGVSQRGL